MYLTMSPDPEGRTMLQYPKNVIKIQMKNFGNRILSVATNRERKDPKGDDIEAMR